MKNSKLIILVTVCIVSLTMAEFTGRGLSLILSLVGWFINLFLIVFVLYSLIRYLRTKEQKYFTSSLTVLAFILTFHLAGPDAIIRYFDGDRIFQGGCEHTMDWVHLVLMEDNDAFMYSGMETYAGRSSGSWSLSADTVKVIIDGGSGLEKYILMVQSDGKLLGIDHNTRGHNHLFKGDTRNIYTLTE